MSSAATLTYTLVSMVGLPFWVAVIGAAIGTAVIGYIIEVLFVDKWVDDHTASMLITLGIYLITTTGIVLLFGPSRSAAFHFRSAARCGQADFTSRIPA